MRETRLTMGMPATVTVVDGDARAGIAAVFNYFDEVDRQFSPYTHDSEVAELNRNPRHRPSDAMREVLALAEDTKQTSGGYFDIMRPDGVIDPSGIVKGWAIKRAATLLRACGHINFCIDVGGDIALSGSNEAGEDWRVGIRSPFIYNEVVKILTPRAQGIATSGSSARGDHIYNPHNPAEPLRTVVSVTVVAPDVLRADQYATAAFAMGERGVAFIESLPDCEAYQIGADGIATMTSGFLKHCA